MDVFFTGVAVRNFQLSCAWYERFLGRAPDMFPNAIEAAWHIADSAWMYVILDPERAGNALLTLIIDNLNERLSDLAGRGFSPVGVEEDLNKYRKVSFRDPDGNTFSLGQVFRADG